MPHVKWYIKKKSPIIQGDTVIHGDDTYTYNVLTDGWYDNTLESAAPAAFAEGNTLKRGDTTYTYNVLTDGWYDNNLAAPTSVAFAEGNTLERGETTYTWHFDDGSTYTGGDGWYASGDNTQTVDLTPFQSGDELTQGTKVYTYKTAAADTGWSC